MADLSTQLHKMKISRGKLASLPLRKRNQLVMEMARALLAHKRQILKFNRREVKLSKRTELADRLRLDSKRIRAMAESARVVAKLPDPINRVLEQRVLPSGLRLRKISVPLGTVGVIYESRPNVTFDLAVLAIKSGNALVLKGGSDAYNTNKILVDVIKKVLRRHRLPSDLVHLIALKDEWKEILLNAHGLVDVLIPRGGAGLIRWVRENSKVPIIETGAGVCHTFVDEGANIHQAVEIIINAKTQRPDVCNALDTLVVHQQAAKNLLPALAASLAEFKVEIFADCRSFSLLKRYYPSALLKQAGPEHYGCEFLSLKMSIKTVKNFDQGLEFIKQKTSHHSEAILSRNREHISRFFSEIDAAVVYANASTRFTDGGEFGMGAEVGISTQKLHARGPMGLEALTSYKWAVKGIGQARK